MKLELYAKPKDLLLMQEKTEKFNKAYKAKKAYLPKKSKISLHPKK